MLSTEFIRSTCRADVDGFGELSDEPSNKKLLQELLFSSIPVTISDQGTIWHQEAAKGGVYFFTSRKLPDRIGLYMPYQQVSLTPELSAIEVSSWQSSVMCGFGRGWQIARDEVFVMLLRRSLLVVSSDHLREHSGGRFWEDRVGNHILAGGRGGSVRDGVLVYQKHWSWFAPDHLGRDGLSRFFIQAADIRAV